MGFGKLGFAAGLAAALIGCAPPTFAQDENPPAVAARIAYLSGNVSLEAQGADDWSSAPLNYPMVSGDRIYTSQGARAIIQSGATDVRLWGGSDVTLTNLNEQYEQIGIAQGAIRLRVFALDSGNTVEVDTPSGAVIIQQPGDYRVNVYPEQQASLVEVNSGTVQITGPDVNQEVDQGQAVQLYGTNPVEVGEVEIPGYDGLDFWSQDRDRHILNSMTGRYVSHDIPGYDDLDDYGSWTPTPDYGPMWFPSSMPYGWQPYTLGHWAWIPPWGYTWVDDAAWGYAPFHYGRWMQWRGRWGWVPGPRRVRPIYAPAFVAFVGGGPGFYQGFGGGGVAAWFPLGVAEPYVPWYRCSPNYVRQVNVTNVNITEVHNTTIVNNYNTFITNVSNVRTVNDIRVNNITYVNRTHVVAVPEHVMVSGVRVQQGMVRLNPQQRQALVRAPIAVARTPVAAPPHPVVGPRINVSRPVARPVLVTPHGRVAAIPAANTAHFNPRSLAKPAPSSAIRPATRAIVPNVRLAAPNHAGSPGQPVNRPVQPAYRAPETRPGAPATRPGQPAYNVRPPQPNRPAKPEYIRPATRPPVHPEYNRPARPENRAAPETRTPPNEARPHPNPPVDTRTSPPVSRPAPRPETRPAPPPARPEDRPVPQNRPTPRPEAHPVPPARTPPPKNREQPPPRGEHPPQQG